MNNKNKPSARKIVSIILVCALFLTIILFRSQIADIWNMLKDQQAISTFVQKFGSFGPVILFCLLIAQVFIAIIPGHALMMAGGFMYGPVVAITVTATSTIIGSMIAFWVARRYGRKLVRQLAKKNMHVIDHWDRIAEKQGALFFFFTFVLPIFPSDLMCYVAGLGKVEPRKFLLANVAGRMICATTITLIGVFGMDQPWQFWAIVLIGLAALFIAWGIYENRGLKNTISRIGSTPPVIRIRHYISGISSNWKNQKRHSNAIDLPKITIQKQSPADSRQGNNSELNTSVQQDSNLNRKMILNTLVLPTFRFY